MKEADLKKSVDSCLKAIAQAKNPSQKMEEFCGLSKGNRSVPCPWLSCNPPVERIVDYTGVSYYLCNYNPEK